MAADIQPDGKLSAGGKGEAGVNVTAGAGLYPVAPARPEAAAAISVPEVARVVGEALETKTPAKIIVVAATPEDRREAKAAGLSLCRHLLLKAAEKEGKVIPVHELKEKKLGEIEVRNNLVLEEIFRSQSKDVIILEENAGEKEKPAGNLPAQTERQEWKTPHLPEQSQPLPREAGKSPLPRQEQVIPEEEAKTDREKTKISPPELTEPAVPEPEIPVAPPPEKPELKEPAVEKSEKPEKPIEPRQPSLPVIIPEEETPAQEEKQFPVAPEEKTEPASRTEESPATGIDFPSPT